jgi:hypothetical protein
VKEFTKMVEYAIKAPSGHNTQPWKFKITNEAIDVYPDFSRSLPVADNDHRALYISVGAATENLCIAAHELGYESYVSILTDDRGKYYVRIDLQEVEKLYSDPLFMQIPKRQTNRKVYTGWHLADDTIEVLKGVLLENDVHTYFYKNGEEEFNKLREFVYRGNEILMNNNNFKDELIEWSRLKKEQVVMKKDGLAYAVMDLPTVPEWIRKPILKLQLNTKIQNKLDQKKIDSSSHLVLFTTSNNTPEGWIAMGRSLERFLLETTLLGVADAFLNQPCKVNVLAEEMMTKLDINGEYPTLLMRIGHASPMPYSPRKEINEVTIMQN